MMPGLLYYSLLNPNQRQATRDGLAVAKLPVSLQRAFQQVVLIGSLTAGHARLVATVVTGDLSQLGITVSEKGQAGNRRPKIASRNLMMSFGNSEERMEFASAVKAPAAIAR